MDEHLARALQQCVHSVGSCKLWPEGLRRLASLVGADGKGETVQRLLGESELYLDGCGWDWSLVLAAGCSALLCHDGSLRVLHLGHNNLGETSLRAVAAALSANRTLTTLHLRHNPLSLASAEAIGDALVSNTTLRTLDLASSALELEGGSAVCRGLLRNTTLTKLSLMSNDLGGEAAPMLTKLVSANVTLVALDLRSNGLGDAFDARRFAAALRANEVGRGALNSVDLRLNRLSDAPGEGKQALQAFVDAASSDAERTGRLQVKW